MRVFELEKEVLAELETEKTELAKGVVKERIREIKNVERMLDKLKKQYQEILEKSVEEVVEDIENGNIRF